MLKRTAHNVKACTAHAQHTYMRSDSSLKNNHRHYLHHIWGLGIFLALL